MYGGSIRSIWGLPEGLLYEAKDYTQVDRLCYYRLAKFTLNKCSKQPDASPKVEYWAMTLKMDLVCGNQAAMHIVSDAIFREDQT